MRDVPIVYGKKGVGHCTVFYHIILEAGYYSTLGTNADYNLSETSLHPFCCENPDY